MIGIFRDAWDENFLKLQNHLATTYITRSSFTIITVFKNLANYIINPYTAVNQNDILLTHTIDNLLTDENVYSMRMQKDAFLIAKVDYDEFMEVLDPIIDICTVKVNGLSYHKAPDVKTLDRLMSLHYCILGMVTEVAFIKPVDVISGFVDSDTYKKELIRFRNKLNEKRRKELNTKG